MCGGFQKWWYQQNVWLTTENPMNMDDLGVSPL